MLYKEIGTDKLESPLTPSTTLFGPAAHVACTPRARQGRGRFSTRKSTSRQFSLPDRRPASPGQLEFQVLGDFEPRYQRKWGCAFSGYLILGVWFSMEKKEENHRNVRRPILTHAHAWGEGWRRNHSPSHKCAFLPNHPTTNNYTSPICSCPVIRQKQGSCFGVGYFE